ncbi:MAG: VOC family protein [Pseudonocardia sp.]|nr:VOC family protein [Pseudonocardia sp.]
MSIDSLHHVGHVIADVGHALASYRRMGFHVPPLQRPVLPDHPGRPSRAVGVANSHIGFAHEFVELIAVVDDGPYPDDEIAPAPLTAPAAALPDLDQAIAATAARLTAALARFEGLHVLCFGTADADATAARLHADGVTHSGVKRARRPSTTGGAEVPIGYLEIDDSPGLSPEGRLAVSEPLPQDRTEHPNGAFRLAGTILCVTDDELADHEARYRRYLHRAARDDGPARTFDLGGQWLTIVPQSGLGQLLPGERPQALPAFVAYAVEVRSPEATRRYLHSAGVPLRACPAGDAVVPAASALGAAVIFRGA